MTKIEIQLYAIDENTQNSRHFAHQANTKKLLAHSKSNKSNMQRKQFQPHDLNTVRCYKCNNMGHYANKCPLKTHQKDTVAKENGNLANPREITLNNTSSDDIQVNMAQISNVGRKSKHLLSQIPLAHDLYNRDMDSGATCHMTPYQSGFIEDSIKNIKKVVEVADGHDVPANLFGTVLIKTKND